MEGREIASTPELFIAISGQYASHFLLAGMIGLVLVACAQALVLAPGSPIVRYWPAHPEQPRYVHAGTVPDSDSIRPASEDDRMRQLFTGTGASKIAVRNPLAVAARGGRI